DLLFTASDGLTKLSHELENYNPVTGQLIVWVAIPSLSPGADTTIYAYYGNSGATDQQNKAGVWDSNYVGVWHLGNGSVLTASGSTSGGNNGTITSASAGTGQAGGGATFTGSGNIALGAGLN